MESLAAAHRLGLPICSSAGCVLKLTSTVPLATFVSAAPQRAAAAVAPAPDQTQRSSSQAALSVDWPSAWPPPSQEEAGHGSHAVAAAIANKLNASGAEFWHLGPHEACRTSEDSVRVRQARGWKDTTLRSGAKAMLLVSKDQGPALIVMPADGRLSWRKARSVLPGSKKSEWRLASEEEVASITGGCVPGSVPPFGSVFQQPVQTYADNGLGDDNGMLNFNCGLRTRSIKVSVTDYLACEQPASGDFVDAAS